MSHTAQDYADAVALAMAHIRRHDDVLGDLMWVDWQIELHTTERITNDGIEMPSAPVVEWSAEGYAEAYADDLVAADYSRGDWRESSAPDDVAERIALVWEEAADAALNWELQHMWGVITGDDSEYPGDRLEWRDLDYTYLEVCVWENYFIHRVGKDVSPREAVAAYNAAPDEFRGKRDAFVEVYGDEPSALITEEEDK